MYGRTKSEKGEMRVEMTQCVELGDVADYRINISFMDNVQPKPSLGFRTI